MFDHVRDEILTLCLCVFFNSNHESCLLLSVMSSQLIVVCVSVIKKKVWLALCHEKHFLLRLAEAETFRQTGGGWRGLHQIQQCRICAESECIQSSLQIVSLLSSLVLISVFFFLEDLQ